MNIFKTTVTTALFFIASIGYTFGCAGSYEFTAPVPPPVRNQPSMAGYEELFAQGTECTEDYTTQLYKMELLLAQPLGLSAEGLKLFSRHLTKCQEVIALARAESCAAEKRLKTETARRKVCKTETKILAEAIFQLRQRNCNGALLARVERQFKAVENIPPCAHHTARLYEVCRLLGQLLGLAPQAILCVGCGANVEPSIGAETLNSFFACPQGHVRCEECHRNEETHVDCTVCTAER